MGFNFTGAVDQAHQKMRPIQPFQLDARSGDIVTTGFQYGSGDVHGRVALPLLLRLAIDTSSLNIVLSISDAAPGINWR